MRKTLFLIIFVLLLLMLAALIVFNTEPGGRYQQRGAYRIFPRETAHLFGWAGLTIFTASTFYSALKRVSPKNVKTWLLIHCIMGELSIVLVFFHTINKIQALKTGYFISIFTLLLMVVIVVSGILGRYVKTGFIKDYWKTLHVPLTIIFYVTLTFHILEKMNLLW
ncbi:MAG: hypothetical protein ACKD6N_07760 [Candidatus Bathyarchaeota archaeon]